MSHRPFGTLSAIHVSKHRGGRPVLRDVSLTVGSRSRVGVVGPNGIGKSTLLQVLAGLMEPDAGSVSRAPSTLEVGYLPQESDARLDESVRAYLARRTGVADAERALHEAAGALVEQPSSGDAYSEALDRFLALGGADMDARAASACAAVGLEPRYLDARMSELSGGERARAALAALALARFEIFLLDEPTNDLDFDGLEQLERFLSSVPGAVVVVSHDRAFLDRTVTRVLEFEAETGRTHEYAGGWAEYERAREAKADRHRLEYAHYKEERQRFGDLLQERRGQARAGGKQANRRGTNALSSKVRTAERRLERLERVEKPWNPWELHLALTPGTRGGDVAARLERAVVERPGFRLGPVDLELRWQDRLAVVGPNGSGKTTLLQALVGTTPLAAGSRYIGPGVVLGELDQARGLFGGQTPLLEIFTRESQIPAAEARNLLAKFNLRADLALRPAGRLSPGERTRAVLALLSARGVNCLILDEPTNHLDLEAIEELENALRAYEGTVVLVTHDRRFLETFDARRTLDLKTPQGS
ncbi:MAG: ABC-F family ATP-binding cassette domain-containing protein [Actinobacteria bacterium]|nr:ABC-F family ATP-binding cassette domain-containing protein [Actinomycetota bacterium]